VNVRVRNPEQPASPVPDAPLLFPLPLVASPVPYPPCPVPVPLLLDVLAAPQVDTTPLLGSAEKLGDPLDEPHDDPPAPPPAEN